MSSTIYSDDQNHTIVATCYLMTARFASKKSGSQLVGLQRVQYLGSRRYKQCKACTNRGQLALVTKLVVY